MFNRNKLKKIKMEYQELENEVVSLKGALIRANEANKELDKVVKELNTELGLAIDRIKYLSNEVHLRDAAIKSRANYSDESRNY